MLDWVSEANITSGKNVSGSLVRQQSYAEPLSPVFLNLRDAGAEINQRARQIFGEHPAHVIDVEKHHALDAHTLIEEIYGGKIIASCAE